MNTDTEINKTLENQIQQGIKELYSMKKYDLSQVTVLGKLDIHMQKNEIRPLSYVTHKKLTGNGLKN